MKNSIKYEITDHAKIRLQVRNISLDEILKCLKNPGQIITLKKGRFVYQSKLPSNGKLHLIRLVVEKEKKFLKVITVYKTNKIGKYWKEE